jgi:putative addiction module component (TIGR02574 family)
MSSVDFKNMNVTDKLQYMEEIWNSLLDDEGKIESPEWHKDILADRKAKIKSGKTSFITVNELKAKYNRE